MPPYAKRARVFRRKGGEAQKERGEVRQGRLKRRGTRSAQARNERGSTRSPGWRGAQISVGGNIRWELLGIDPLFQCGECGDDLVETHWFHKIHVTHVLIITPKVSNA